jgi:hypothetical protein
VGDGVEGGEPLVDTHGVVGAQHRDAGSEPDPLGLAGDGSEDDVGGGDGEVRAMVLADPEVVDSDLVGQDALGDHLADGFGVAHGPPVGSVGDVAERVQAERRVLRCA